MKIDFPASAIADSIKPFNYRVFKTKNNEKEINSPRRRRPEENER